jgi:hypothetical protein
MSHTETCIECRRVLLYSSGTLVCCNRHCGEYGRDQGDDEPTPSPQPASTRHKHQEQR